jgi:thiol:disulfide interchange protein
MAMRFLTGLMLALAALLAPAMAQAAPVNTGHLVAELGAEAQGIAPGQTIRIALSQTIQKGWHTYWRNPGDSGEPPSLTWTLPAGWTAGEFIWPTPRRLPVGPLVNYGYADAVTLPLSLTAPADAKVGETVTLKAAATFLVCADVCIPENATLELPLRVVAAPAAADPAWGPKIVQAIAAAPVRADLSATFKKTGDIVKLAVTGAPLKGAAGAGAYFYAYGPTNVEHAKPQATELGPDGLTISFSPGYDFQQPPGPQALEGVLAVDGKAYEITAKAGALPPAAAGLGAPKAQGGGLGGAAGSAPGGGLVGAALFAFIGGLILNLMPCVFPILAMKAASLAGHAHDSRESRRQGLAFGAGVLASFLLLAGVLIGLKAAGSAVGWGFQLQSPPVVAGLALLMLAVSLNLSGVFEIGASLQGAGSGLTARGGLSGAVFTGVLAVVVAAPCTAPFMAPAIGWALTQPPAAALTVFLALALGFAAPFVAVAFAPALLARLPKPGPWMDGFKKLLAFPMYAAAGWLVWVLTLQAGPEALARILAAGVVLACGAWLLGAAQRRRAAGQPIALPAGFGAAFAAIALVVALGLPYAAASSGGEGDKARLGYEAWSPEKVAALQAEGRPVLVNFTAAWCVSCQVNDKVALSTKGVAEAMAKHNVAYLKADWTRKDAAIAAELARHGRAGVPLYLVYGASSRDVVILPNILTEGVVVRALETASKPG